MKTGRNNPPPSANAIFILVLTACLFSPGAFAQKIDNVEFEVIENVVKIRYDIEGCSDDETYDIRLSLGMDGNVTELVQGLSGDLWHVRCGNWNTITWDVLADRDELKGRIYFVVTIEETHKVEIPRTEKTKSYRRSWKADRGYIGGSVGLFSPYENFAYSPDTFDPKGFFINGTVAYLPGRFLGICASLYIYGAVTNHDFEIASWTNCGIMMGPLVSFPIGNKIKWELRPQIGYSISSAYSNVSTIPDELDDMKSGLAYNIGTGFRLNLGKRTCYLLNVEYFSGGKKFEDYPIEPEVGTLGASVGIAFRFF